MELQALGYFGVRARNLEDWTAFATRLLGFEQVRNYGSWTEWGNLVDAPIAKG